MAFAKKDGTKLSETALNALTENPPASTVVRVMTEEVWQSYTAENTTRFDGAQRLLFRKGQVVPQVALDALFKDATVTSFSPAGGPAAGGTPMTIRGTNFGGVLGVTVGGTAATQVRAVDETTITCVAPAHATGPVSVIVQDDANNVTASGNFTYA